MNNQIDLKNITVGVLMNENYEPSFLAGTHILEVLAKNNINTRKLNLENIIQDEIGCDTLFNVYYGEVGDGGLVSGILEERGIKFIGNSQYTCSLMWNKVITKIFIINNGYTTPAYWYDYNNNKSKEELLEEIESKVEYPMIVKPVNGAVSEDVHVFKAKSELSTFIEKNLILIHNGYYFVEKFIRGIEVSAGYVNAVDQLLPVVQISLKDSEFQTNKVKFTPGLKENIIPAKLDKEVYGDVQCIARDLNLLFKASTFSRTDIIYSPEEDKLYILEINSNPGLLEKSLLPLMVSTAGISHDDLFIMLIKHSLESN